MSTNLRKEEEKENTILQEGQKNTTRNTLTLTELLNSTTTKTKGLSLAIDNRVLEGYAKPLEEHGKGFKIKQISRLFSILIANKKNQLNSYISFDTVAKILDLNTNVSTNRLKSDVRKALRELYPTIEFKEDHIKGIKFTYIPKENYTEVGKTKGFTQLYCDLDFIKNKELIVVFTVLEYFKGSSKELYPSIDTLAFMCGCSRTKILKLLKEGEKLPEEGDSIRLWKIVSTKGGTKKHTNRYELSYITEDGQERYYYLDLLEDVIIASIRAIEDKEKEQIV